MTSTPSFLEERLPDCRLSLADKHNNDDEQFLHGTISKAQCIIPVIYLLHELTISV